MVVDIPQLRPIWAGDPLSPEDRAKLDAMAAEYDREVAAEIAREAGSCAASRSPAVSTTCGRRAATTTGPSARWQERHNALLGRSSAIPAKCCGEWQRSGLLRLLLAAGASLFFREEGATKTAFRSCGVAIDARWRYARDRIGGWYVDRYWANWKQFEHGEIDV